MMIPGYNPADFEGREQELQAVVGLIRQFDAPHRCLVVEGPPRAGKTWFLHKVADELHTPPATPAGSYEARVCFFESVDLAPDPTLSPFEQSQCAYGLLRKLWATVADWLGAHDPPPPLSVSPLLAQVSHVVTMLQTRQVAGLNDLLVLVLDGLDEIDPRQISAFERQIATFLFDSPLVRILCSRRVKSTQHRFRDLRIRRSERWIPLTPYDGAERQVDKLLVAAGSSARFATLKAQLPRYNWTNPGANRCFVEAYLRASLISPRAIGDCLDQLLRAVRHGPASDRTRQRLGDVVRALAPTPGRPVPRYELEQALGQVSLRERADFIGELQERGVAVLEGTEITIHAEIVELCRELDARRVRYGY